MSVLEFEYCYGGPSRLAGGAASAELSLAAALDGEAGPRDYLRARVRAPEVTAKALRAVSEIVGARFYVPPAMLGRILREADPVATVSPGAVRFEGFSGCCSAYVRLDIGDRALDAEVRRNGTTNVDFGPELRAALATVGRDSALEITIGRDAVGVAHERAAAVERKVPLPVRWIKGFGEVQVQMAGMAPAFALPRVAAHRFLRALPRGRSDHLQWVSAPGGTARIAARQAPGAVPLRGAHRLRVLEALAPAARELRVYANDAQASTAWVLDFGAQRLVLVLNAEPWRGFSGDGGLLSRIAEGDAAGVAALRAQLNWQDRIDPARLARATGLSADRVDTGLARLAAIGLVGYDLAEGAYFHRVLPFDLDRLPRLNPRLEAAIALVEAGAVTLAADGGSAKVGSGDVTHRVRGTGEGARCTCPWFARHKGARGPCKHVLAVEIARGRSG